MVAGLEGYGLQAGHGSRGAVHSDLFQAGLLRNPLFLGREMFSDRSLSGRSQEFGLVQGFLDVLLRSERNPIAGARLKKSELPLAAEAIDFGTVGPGETVGEGRQ